jgi:hypothetical protein
MTGSSNAQLRAGRPEEPMRRPRPLPVAIALLAGGITAATVTLAAAAPADHHPGRSSGADDRPAAPPTPAV